jgi:hypothetical protein
LVLKSLTANNIFINDLNIYLEEFLIFFLDFFFGGMFIGLVIEIIGNRHHIFIDDTFLETIFTMEFFRAVILANYLSIFEFVVAAIGNASFGNITKENLMSPDVRKFAFYF